MLNDSPTQCPFATCQCDTENMNTVLFRQNYRLTGINQHKYAYRLKSKAKGNPALNDGQYGIEPQSCSRVLKNHRTLNQNQPRDGH
jgi:hypothetical protein